MYVFFIAFLGIPFFYIWNALAPIYFYQLPPVYQHFPFWHAVGLFALIGIARMALLPHHHHHFGHGLRHGFGQRWKHRH